MNSLTLYAKSVYQELLRWLKKLQITSHWYDREILKINILKVSLLEKLNVSHRNKIMLDTKNLKKIIYPPVINEPAW